MLPKFIKKLIRKLVLISVPETELFFAKEYPNLLNNLKYSNNIQWSFLSENLNNNKIGKVVKIYPPSHISNSEIGDYSYIATNSYISDTKIGKFCSIGPNLICGWGIHPTTTLSTSPYFYSTRKQNGDTLSKTDKIEERKPIKIGNDVFIGANVTILDGITIGDGAVIGAGAVVSKDIPPYSIAVGCPIKIIKKRFDDNTIEKLQKIQWWNFDKEKLKDVEKMFFDINGFIEKYN